MKHPLSSIAALGAAATLAFCGGDPLGPFSRLPRELSEAEVRLIEADNRFAVKLFRELESQAQGENLFISPLSVALALGMTYNGADGTTREGMAQALELQGLSLQQVNEAYRDLMDLLLDLDPRVRFEIANSIWHRSDVAPQQSFLDMNRDYFDATVSALDFADPGAAGTINDWVADNTGGKIKQIVPDPIPASVVMFLINAIYFKADWTQQFAKDLTRNAPFTLEDGTETLVETMFHEVEANVRRFSDDLVDVVEMPYGGDAFAMTVLVPQRGRNLDELIDALDDERWRALTSGLADAQVVVGMPKFTLEYEISLNDVLGSLGMGDAFTGEADFSNMIPGGGVWISDVKHKTFVQVDEEGTEAAAATAVIIVESAGPAQLLIDRPFLFVIRERFSGTIVFMGKMVDPTS